MNELQARFGDWAPWIFPERPKTPFSAKLQLTENKLSLQWFATRLNEVISPAGSNILLHNATTLSNRGTYLSQTISVILRVTIKEND